jgi:hypothetical protein
MTHDEIEAMAREAVLSHYGLAKAAALWGSVGKGGLLGGAVGGAIGAIRGARNAPEGQGFRGALKGGLQGAALGGALGGAAGFAHEGSKALAAGNTFRNAASHFSDVMARTAPGSGRVL